jgi:hypothetical protein
MGSPRAIGGPRRAPLLMQIRFLVVFAFAAAFVLVGLALYLLFRVPRFVARRQRPGTQSKQRQQGERTNSSLHLTTPLSVIQTVAAYP